MNLVKMLRDDLIVLILAEEIQAETAITYCEKADRINNILQLKIESQIPELKADIYINVKKFINYYINSTEEKQFNYDEFDRNKIYNYLKLFDVEQKCSLLHFTIRHLKSIGLEEKVKYFELELSKAEFLKEWKCIGFKNIFKIIYLATVYNNLTILIAIVFCITLKAIIYLPAPDGWPVLYKLHYYSLNDNSVLNHFGNVILSIFDIQEDPSFVKPLTTWGAILLVLGKCFFILIVINILIDQLKQRFKF
jgi:hypothetical protein